MLNMSIHVRNKIPKAQSEAVKNFLSRLPLISMMESHYCRKSSDKLYVNQVFNTMNDFFEEYKRHSLAAAMPFVKKTKWLNFMALCKERKITVYAPKKDLCDKCVAFKCKQLSQADYQQQITNKNLARVSIKIINYKTKII